MIKRMNKVTSLLVAAAAIVSLVPATGVSAADRLGNKEGTINSAVAFDGGKYIYQGYRTKDDDSAVYYNAGDKDKALEDLSDAEIKGTYGTKYAKVEDGSDKYLVDLSTGKVVDETAEEIQENVEIKLRSNLRKTDRYDFLKDIKNANVTFNVSEGPISGNFADAWYSYNATTTGAAKFYGFTNESGKYIDASFLANMSVVVDNNTVVRVDKFGKEKEYGKDNNKVKVELMPTDAATSKEPIEVIAQDKDSIYTKTKVNITTGAAGAVTVTEKTYIQKISKAQGETEDGAYVPKKVESFDITTAFDSSDISKAEDVLDNANVTYNVIKGVLYATELKGDKATVTTIKLKKSKVATKDAVDADKANNTNNATKLDVYVAEKDQDDDQEVQNAEASISYDVDGNTWVINKGSIYKFDGKEFKEIYTCDRALNTLDVYNEGSLIAWEDGEDVYTTVQEGKKATEGEATPAQTGWVNTAAGWTFYDNAGKQVVGSWVNAGGTWYMIKADGMMATGWYNDNGTWYYTNASGAMQTGWANVNGTWYYLQSSGAMKTGWLNDNGTWYFLNASGSMQTGWFNDNGTWYFLNSNGSMAANTTVNGYTLGANGAWIR